MRGREGVHRILIAMVVVRNINHVSFFSKPKVLPLRGRLLDALPLLRTTTTARHDGRILYGLNDSIGARGEFGLVKGRGTAT